MWVDTHAHLDAPEFAGREADVVARARAAGVTHIVLPAIDVASGQAVRALAHAHGLYYALGIHPLYVGRQPEGALAALAAQLAAHRDDPRLVAVGEIGLDFFVPGHDAARQNAFYVAQLKLARDAGLPVLLHGRQSADALLAGLRRVPVAGGIAHAFNGSLQQAGQFIDRGFALGFGGALVFERALHLRRLAVALPPEALVLETDAPDIPPPWLYVTAQARAAGVRSPPNEPAELPRMAQTLGSLRGLAPDALAALTGTNARRVLPGLRAVPLGPAAHL